MARSETETDDRGVVVSHDGPVLSIVLGRPHRKNALTVDMIRAVTDAVRGASMDDTTRVVVVSSSGPDFCSGIDLVQSNAPAEQGTPPRARAGHLQRRLGDGAHQMILTLAASQVPVVAAVRGWAAGIGNMLALSADFVVASSTAKFWVPFVTKGFTPDSGNTWLLPRLIGVARAKDMILRGRPVDGEQAVSWGLVTRCVPDDELDSATGELVQELAASATVAVGLAKSLIHQNLACGLEAALQHEAIHEELAVRSDDFKEGMRAFAAKRPPDYTGW